MLLLLLLLLLLLTDDVPCQAERPVFLCWKPTTANTGPRHAGTAMRARPPPPAQGSARHASHRWRACTMSRHACPPRAARTPHTAQALLAPPSLVLLEALLPPLRLAGAAGGAGAAAATSSAGGAGPGTGGTGPFATVAGAANTRK